MSNEEIMNAVKPVICSKLKSPSSAQFPDDLISITGDDYQGYKVTGFVDSQNTYGAMVRSDFSATVSVAKGFPVVESSSVGIKAGVKLGVQFGLNYVVITIFAIIIGIIVYFIFSEIAGF